MNHFQPTHQITIVYNDGATGHMPVMLDEHGFALTHRQWADGATGSDFRQEENRWVFVWPRGALSVSIEKRTPADAQLDERERCQPGRFEQGEPVEVLTIWAHDTESAWFKGYHFHHYETDGTTALVLHSDGPFRGTPVRQRVEHIRRARASR